MKLTFFNPESNNLHPETTSDEMFLARDLQQMLYVPVLAKLDNTQMITANTPTCYSTPSLGNIHQLDTVNPTTGFEFSLKKTREKELVPDGVEYTAYQFWSDTLLPYTKAHKFF